MNNENKIKVMKKLSHIEPFGQTNIVPALNLALKMVNNRRQKNDITSIILLTDGQDPNYNI